MRLQLFCLQLALVHKTGLVFNHHKTKAQAGIKNKSSPQKNNNSKLHELHASTLPNLKFISPETAQSEKIDVFKMDIYVFGLDTPSYMNFNATHKLPRFVNGIDSNIDKNTPIPFFDHFRQFCVKLLNDSSQGSGIEKGFRCFLHNLGQTIGVIKSRTLSKYAITVLDWYNDVVQSYLSRIDLVFNAFFRADVKNIETVCTRLQGNFQREVDISRKLGKRLENNHLIRCAMIALVGLNATSKMIEEYTLDARNSAGYTSSGIITHTISVIQKPEVVAEGRRLLGTVQEIKDVKQAHKQFIGFIKGHLAKGTHHPEYIAIRALQKISEQETDGRHLSKFYSFFCISPGKVQALLQERQPTSVFHQTLTEMRADVRFKQTVTDIAQLLDAFV